MADPAPPPPPQALRLGDPLPIAGVRVIESRLVGDSRGEFSRLFDRDLMAEIHADRPIVQINRSTNREKGTLRGLHFQKAPALEAKCVRCIKGRIFDLVVDLRAGSPTFLQHFSVVLSPEAGNGLYIPEGCAHGFQALEDDSEVLYFNTARYAPEHEAGLRWDDPRLGITWPLEPTVISDRDRAHPLLSADFAGLAV